LSGLFNIANYLSYAIEAYDMELYFALKKVLNNQYNNHFEK